MRKTALDMVYELAKQNTRIIFIGSDLGHGTLSEFKRDLPKQFLMEGVSESCIVGMAAGMAAEGRIVYINTIATFLTRRCYEQIVLDACLHKAKIRLIASGGGVVYAPLGPTHQAIEDISIMRSIPHMTVVSVCDAEEMKRLMPQTVDYDGPIYIRLAKGGDRIVSDPRKPFKIGKAILVREGRDALILTTGVTLQIAMKAAESLQAMSTDVGILHVHTIKPLDEGTILSHAKKVPVIITIEEHSVIGGLGSAVADLLLEKCSRKPTCFKKIGLPDTFQHKYGSQEQILAHQMITPEYLAKTVLELTERAKQGGD